MVARLRRLYGLYARDRHIAAGHLGTLDPQAAGVLPIAVGKATRLIPLLTDQRKAYVCTFVAGRSTTSGDASGETIECVRPDAGWERRLRDALPNFIGKIEQVPPMHSALHHEGKRLYELARAGKQVERRPRTIAVYGLILLGVDGGANGVQTATARLRIACSEGTYVRTLVEDLGKAIGVPAHMGALVREGSGPFLLYESRTLDDIAEHPREALIPPERIIPFPTIVLDLRHSADFRSGRSVPLPFGAAGKHVFVRDESRTLVGVGETHGALLAPRKVFV